MTSLKDKLIQLGIRPSKGMGQNFLTDKNIAKRQVSAADITDSDTVLEIGPGLGILTSEIVEVAGKTIVVEKDLKLANHISQEFGDRVELIIGDFLEMDLPPFNKCVSNIPFNISSPLTFKLLGMEFGSAVLMYQKEYARRMTASPGEKEYSRLSVMTSVNSRVTKLFDVSRNCFYPPPKVDATVIRLEPSVPDFSMKDPEKYSLVVRELFNYRRKQIKNALEYGFNIDIPPDLPYGQKRVGKLSPAQISTIVDFLIDRGLI